MIIVWILMGLITGLIGNRIMNRAGVTKSGVVFDLLLGVVCALAGGFIFLSLNRRVVTAWDVGSTILAFISAVVLFVSFHSFLRQGSRARRG